MRPLVSTGYPRRSRTSAISAVSSPLQLFLRHSPVFFEDFRHYVTWFEAMKGDRGKELSAPDLPPIPRVSASPNVQTRRLRVHFMRCLFVHLGINLRKGQNCTLGLNGKTTPFLCKDTGGLSSDLAALHFRSSVTPGREERRGGGCPDHPVIHIIPCCWGTRPSYVWRASCTLYLLPRLLLFSTGPAQNDEDVSSIDRKSVV